MEFRVPGSLELEHEELHNRLVKAVERGGDAGEAAKTVAEVLHPHFEKEEEYALPPLGLLLSLSNQDNKISSENQEFAYYDREAESRSSAYD